MKADAFSTHERPRIIREVIAHGEWSGTRFGVPVSIKHDRTLIDIDPILVSCRLRAHQHVSFRAATVFEAMEQCNKLIHGDARR